jgi:hypothetical protein
MTSQQSHAHPLRQNLPIVKWEGGSELQKKGVGLLGTTQDRSNEYAAFQFSFHTVNANLKIRNTTFYKFLPSSSIFAHLPLSTSGPNRKENATMGDDASLLPVRTA